MRVIFKQVYLAHIWDPQLGQCWTRFNVNERVLYIQKCSRIGHLTPNSVWCHILDIFFRWRMFTLLKSIQWVHTKPHTLLSFLKEFRSSLSYFVFLHFCFPTVFLFHLIFFSFFLFFFLSLTLPIFFLIFFLSSKQERFRLF